MDRLTRRRRLVRVFFATTAITLVVSLAGVWWLARRLPVQEAQRFMTAPVVVGETPRAVPPPAVARTVEQQWTAATDAFAAGRWVEAGDAFAAVVAEDPAGPHAGPAQWQLTRSRLRSGDANAALTAFHDLVGRHADFLGAEAPALRAGLARLQANDLPGAKAAFERMIAEQPDSELLPVAHALVARIHWTWGQPLETVRAFGRMFASVQDPVPAYATLARQLDRYADGDPEVAQTFGRLAEQGDEGFRDVYQYLAARSLLEQDRFAATREALETLRRRHPGGDFTHIVDLEEAWNLLRNGKPADALAVFERLERTPAPARAAAFDEFFDLGAELPMGIARCLLALGRHADAAAAFERALAERPRSLYAVENQIGLAAAYEGSGRFDDAARVLRTLVAEHADEPQVWALRQQLARVEDRAADGR